MTTEQAAQLKGVGRQAVLDAIARGDLNAVRFGKRMWNVLDDEKFQGWTPAMTQAEKSARRWGKQPTQQKAKATERGKRTHKKRKGERA